MSGSPRIVIGRAAPFDGGGVARVMECWARVLAGAGRDVTVVTLQSDSARPVPSIDGVRAVTVRNDGTGRAGRTFGAARAVAGEIARLRDERGIDLVISHDPFLSGAARAALGRTPILGTFHSPLVEENRLNNWVYAPGLARRASYAATRVLAARVERRALKSVDVAHTLSDYTRGLLTRRYSRATRGLEFQRIPGSYDDERFVPPDDRAAVRRMLGLGPDDTVLLTVRRLVPRTGVDRVVHAARSLVLRHPKVRFLIGGSGELGGALRAEIDAAGLAERVALLGFIAEEKLAAYYQAADAFLLPTRELECFGLPVIEAMGCGCPSLVTPVGGPAEVCREFPSWIAERNSDDAFTELVRRFLDGEIRPTGDLVQRARRQYSDDALAPAIVSLTDRVAGR